MVIPNYFTFINMVDDFTQLIETKKPLYEEVASIVLTLSFNDDITES